MDPPLFPISRHAAATELGTTEIIASHTWPLSTEFLALEELPRHTNVNMAMIYTHAPNCGRLGTRPTGRAANIRYCGDSYGVARVRGRILCR